MFLLARKIPVHLNKGMATPQIILRIAKVPAVPLTETEEEEECLSARTGTLHQILAAAECSHLTNFTCNQIMFHKQAHRYQ